MCAAIRLVKNLMCTTKCDIFKLNMAAQIKTCVEVSIVKLIVKMYTCTDTKLHVTVVTTVYRRMSHVILRHHMCCGCKQKIICRFECIYISVIWRNTMLRQTVVTSILVWICTKLLLNLSHGK